MATNPRDDMMPMPGPSVVTFGFDVLDRVEQAVAMVKERLKRAVAALDAAGIPHAVVGGHAVAAWVSRIDPAAGRPERLREWGSSWKRGLSPPPQAATGGTSNGSPHRAG
jgi:hypothetical protein